MPSPAPQPTSINPTEITFPCWRVQYWRGTAVSHADKADTAWIEVYLTPGGWQTIARINLPDDVLQLGRTLNALQTIFDAGKEARSRELFTLIGGQYLRDLQALIERK